MNSGPTLSMTGHDVRRLQRIFVMTKTLAPSNITGTFDVTTEQAVKDFQQGAGLTVDGIVGPATWQAPSRPQYADISSWCVRQRCDSVTTRSQEVFNSCDRSWSSGRRLRGPDRTRWQSPPTAS